MYFLIKYNEKNNNIIKNKIGINYDDRIATSI